MIGREQSDMNSIANKSKMWKLVLERSGEISLYVKQLGKLHSQTETMDAPNDIPTVSKMRTTCRPTVPRLRS
jgi:hypothetical protein